ncbi:hypothetical protein PR001_g52 [Phytophthora rubi]|uniref:TRAF-type domain-containing protein n=1 Tax=Phytophthora rubi TaxID=129364 RepID=A0A6A3PDV9_9STRA|nr:hypothetical protein PR001_g52 [Phytophthora rubi]
MHELDCHSAETSKVEVGAESNPSETKSALEVGNAAELGGSMKKCRHCSADVPSLDLLEHEINCDKVLKQCPHCLRRQKMSELQDHIENCDCRLVSCPNDCGGKFLQRGIPNHLATRCPKKPVTNSVPVVAAAPRPAYPDANKPTPPPQTAQPPSAAAPSGTVECKFCDDEIEASRIDDHEQKYVYYILPIAVLSYVTTEIHRWHVNVAATGNPNAANTATWSLFPETCCAMRHHAKRISNPVLIATKICRSLL